jgi:bifunctional non-homologous end joining protein LigD
MDKLHAMATKSHKPAPAVKFTHEEKLMFPEAKLTKGDLLKYYDAVADKLLPYLRDRPVTLERLPDGVGEGKPQFWQKNSPDYYPNWIARFPLPNERGETVNYALVNDKATLLYLVNQGAVTFHPFFSTVGDLDHPTFVVFDIDPHQTTFANAVKVAKVLQKTLEAHKVKPLIKTTGKTGLHVMAPWKRGGFDEARAWALEIATEVVAKIPDIATLERNIKKRGDRVYLDVMQNSPGKHAVPPYVVRTTPTATVSMPLNWTDLNARLDPKKFTIKTAMKRLKRA